MLSTNVRAGKACDFTTTCHTARVCEGGAGVHPQGGAEGGAEMAVCEGNSLGGFVRSLFAISPRAPGAAAPPCTGLLHPRCTREIDVQANDLHPLHPAAPGTHWQPDTRPCAAIPTPREPQISPYRVRKYHPSNLTSSDGVVRCSAVALGDHRAGGIVRSDGADQIAS